MKKQILKWVSIRLIRYLQKQYKKRSLKNICRLSNQNIAKLVLIQSVLYFFKQQFQAWGYFHPSCVWPEKDEIEFNKLFPVKDFKELDIVVCQNPAAMTFYHNEIFRLKAKLAVRSRSDVESFSRDIKQQLKIWNEWN